MTTAKPKHMAGQTDSADDLIAELARLMAEDAQGDKPKSEPAVTVRIPGGDSPAASAPPKVAEAPSRPVRIPGDNAPAPEPFVFDFDRKPQASQPRTEAPQRVEPAAFAPAFGAPKPVVNEAPVVARPQPAPTAPAEPIAIAPQEVAPPAPVFVRTEPVVPQAEEMPELDQDSLADLIAAELAVGEEPEPHAQRQDDPVDELDVTDAVRGQTFPREADAFGIPPVFGLASGAVTKPEARPVPAEVVAPKIEPAETVVAHSPAVPPQQPKPQALPDPLEEIERLIGPAARVQQAPAAPSPALRSLATPTLPTREPQPATVVTPVRDNTRVSSVEEAILAAAETSGARVEWVEPAIEASLPPEEPVKPARAPRGRVLGLTRSLAGPVVATLLLAVAAVGLYTVLGLGSGTPEGPAPLVAADTTPTKEVPEPTPSADAASQSVVFNEISGVDTGAEEQIVSRDQSDVEAVTQVASTDLSEEGLVNRKVRTVTVRPDGTIVSGSDNLAGSAMLPVDRPSVPEVPGADFSTPDLIANAIANAPATTAEPTPAPAAAPAVVPVQPGSTVPVVDLTGAPVTGKSAPVPLVRPTNFAPQAAATTPVTATPAPAVATAPAATLPVATPAAAQPEPVAAPSSASTAPAYVQLSSQRTEEAARQTAQQIAGRFGPLFGGASLEVQRVDLGDRGIFYRVRVPANSLQDANTICSNVKAAGGDCFTL